jgi:hypothetical protein
LPNPFCPCDRKISEEGILKKGETSMDKIEIKIQNLENNVKNIESKIEKLEAQKQVYVLQLKSLREKKAQA